MNTTPSISIYANVILMWPHTFISVVHPDGHITEYGLMPDIPNTLTGPGRIDITGFQYPTHDANLHGPTFPLTDNQYNSLMEYINQSINRITSILSVISNAGWQRRHKLHAVGLWRMDVRWTS